MATPFSRSDRGLDTDHLGGHLLLLMVSFLLLASALGWLLMSKIGVYEVSQSARLEVRDPLHAVESPLSGRVIASNLSVGRKVKSGEVLLELEAAVESWQRAESESEIAALRSQLAGLELELEAEVRALEHLSQAASLARREAQATARASAATAHRAEDDLRRLEILEQRGLLPEVEVETARFEAERTQSLAEGEILGQVRLKAELASEEADRQARIKRLERDALKLAGELARSETRLKRLEHEVERRSIRAPAVGSIGEITELAVGSFVSEGERLCTVIPAGELRLVADFLPAQAMGRIAPGQSARLHLDGFPALRYGTVPARVVRVAGEPREGLVRVELEIEPQSGSSIPLEHALPGRVEIAIGALAPWELLLQSTGRNVTAAGAGVVR